MRANIKAIIFIIIAVVTILATVFVAGYRVAEMKYTGQDIITVYNQD